MKNTQKKNTQRCATLTSLLFLAIRGQSRAERKQLAQIGYLVREILATCKDSQSRRFYAKVARVVPDEVIFRFLSEIRQDPSIRNRGAVFATKVKEYLERHAQNGPS